MVQGYDITKVVGHRIYPEIGRPLAEFAGGGYNTGVTGSMCCLTGNRLTRLIILVSLAVIFWSGPAQADVDGSYCIGQGYVALETRGIYFTPKRPSIRVIFVGQETISNPITVNAPSPTDKNRQIHCEPKRIVISDGVVIDLRNPKKPKIAQKNQTPTQTFAQNYLPLIRESKATSIPSPDKKHYYSLILSHVEERAPPTLGALLHHFSARVVQMDSNGRLVDSRVLGEGIRLETGGD